MACIIVRSNRRHQARAAGSTAAQDEWPQVFLWYSVLDSVHCSRASVLPRLGPSPGPGGSCPRRTNSARTTSRPATRTNRRTGDTPPTPHHVLGRGGRSCPLEPHPSPDAAGPNRLLRRLGYDYQSKTQMDTRPENPMITSALTTSGSPGRVGPAQCHQPATVPKGPSPEIKDRSPRAGTLDSEVRPPR